MAASRFPSWLLPIVLLQVLACGIVRSVEDNLLDRKQMCLNKYCKGLFDANLKLCYKTFCQKSLDNDYTDCILDNCATHVGFLRKVCVYDKCGRKNKKPKNKAADEEDPLMTEAWSGEQSASKPDYESQNLDDLWFSDDFGRIADGGGAGRPEVELGDHGDGTRACDIRCKQQARSGGEDYETCLVANCKIDAKRSGGVMKRWSTRMCMESHCKSANNKVQYFLCGKEHCHK